MAKYVEHVEVHFIKIPAYDLNCIVLIHTEKIVIDACIPSYLSMKKGVCWCWSVTMAICSEWLVDM